MIRLPFIDVMCLRGDEPSPEIEPHRHPAPGTPEPGDPPQEPPVQDPPRTPPRPNSPRPIQPNDKLSSGKQRPAPSIPMNNLGATRPVWQLRCKSGYSSGRSTMRTLKRAPCYMIGLGMIVAIGTSGLVAQSIEEFDVASPDEPSVTATSGNSDIVPQKVVSSIVEQTNAFRTKHNLPSVQVNEQLQDAAQYFADFMARTNKYGHRADGQTPSQRARDHGYQFCLVLENIAYTYRSTGYETSELADQFFNGWKNSPGHRENMLDPDVTETAVAIAQDEQQQTFAVQMFGRPRDQAIQFSITNQSGEQIEYTVKRKNGERSFKLSPAVTRQHAQCRPSRIDVAWTEQDDTLAVEDESELIVKKNAQGNLELTRTQSR